MVISSPALVVALTKLVIVVATEFNVENKLPFATEGVAPESTRPGPFPELVSLDCIVLKLVEFVPYKAISVVPVPISVPAKSENRHDGIIISPQRVTKGRNPFEADEN